MKFIRGFPFALDPQRIRNCVNLIFLDPAGLPIPKIICPPVRPAPFARNALDGSLDRLTIRPGIGQLQQRFTDFHPALPTKLGVFSFPSQSFWPILET